MLLKRLLTIIIKLFLGIFIIAYPFAVFYALGQDVATRFIGLILLMVVIFSFLQNKNKYLFTLGLTLSFLVIIFNQNMFLKIYPVLMNFSIGSIFALSLQKTPIITQFAQKMQKKALNEKTLIYTKHATLAWALFMFVNTIFSFITVFLSNKIWALYNGFISYILIGIMMLCEYIVRKRKEKCLYQ